MNKIICTTLAFFFLTIMSAQVAETNYGMLKLKGGERLIGDISENEDGSYTLTEKDGFQINLDNKQVKRILDSKEALVFKNGAYHDINGFFWGMNLGFNSGGMGFDSEYRTIHLEPLFGWRVSKRLLLAAAYGFEINVYDYERTDDEKVFLSPYLHGRYYLNDKKYRLFSYGRVGYGFQMPSFEGGQTDGNGVQFQLGAGVTLPSKNRSKFSISMGWHMQRNEGSRLYLDAFDNPVSTNFDLWISRSVLKVGYEFN